MTEQNLFNLCEQEKLHLSGAIQAHGACLIVTSSYLVIHASTNLNMVIGINAERLLNETLPKEWQELIERFEDDRLSKHNYVFQVAHGDDNKILDVIISYHGENIALEFIPHHCAQVYIEPPAIKNNVPENQNQLNRIIREITEYIAQLTNFERVMYYRFREDGDGEVVAEVCHASVSNRYLGLRYPASDVPQIARQLYLSNPWRFIADAAADPVLVLSVSQYAKPDLSLIDLRSVSPVHQAYLHNMGGIRTACSFPVIINNELVALIAAHHPTPTILPLSVLTLADRAVKNHTTLFANYQLHHRMRLVDKLQLHFVSLSELLASEENLHENWEEIADFLTQTFHCDGVSLHYGHQTLTFGETFDNFSRSTVQAHVMQKHELVWLSQRFATDVVNYPASEIAGAIVVQLGKLFGHIASLYLTRVEYVHEVAWGGNPEKPLATATGLKIFPRRSFEKWVEKRRGYSRGWSGETRLLALKLRQIFTQQ